jgi:hypothetical protein
VEEVKKKKAYESVEKVSRKVPKMKWGFGEEFQTPIITKYIVVPKPGLEPGRA